MRRLMPFLISLCLGLSVHAAEGVLGVQRFHAYDPMLASSGQPKRDQFEAIAAAGYKVVVNVAAVDSNPDAIRDERQLVEKAGMEYYLLPITWQKPDSGQVVAAVRLLEGIQGKPALVHCYVNSRASLVAYLLRSTRDGVSDADELQTMVRIWDQNRGYEFRNSPEWQFVIEDAKKRLKTKSASVQ